MGVRFSCCRLETLGHYFTAFPSAAQNLIPKHGAVVGRQVERPLTDRHAIHCFCCRKECRKKFLTCRLCMPAVTFRKEVTNQWVRLTLIGAR